MCYWFFQAFDTRRGMRKIILATNVAESSITIPDVTYVIDFCLTKKLNANKETNYVSLQLEWADRDSCKQRRGRCGRVGPGRCIRLVPEKFYDSAEYPRQGQIVHFEEFPQIANYFIPSNLVSQI